MKIGICWLCGQTKKVMQTTVDGHHRWLCKKCENINKETRKPPQVEKEQNNG